METSMFFVSFLHGTTYKLKVSAENTAQSTDAKRTPEKKSPPIRTPATPKISAMHLGRVTFSFKTGMANKMVSTELKEKMIAISRLSISDYWCDKMVDTSEVSHQDFYRPQVNDITLRTDMLRTGLIDAAILPEPYAQWMVSEGHKKLKETSQGNVQMGTWIIRRDSIGNSICEAQVKQFIDIYKQAVKEINEGNNPGIVKEILSQEYGIPTFVVDSLKLPVISEGRPITQKEIDEAAKWLTEREREPKKTSLDSINYKL